MQSEPWKIQQIRKASERGRRMARARWKLDRERRDKWAAETEIDPLRLPGRILQRVIVIASDGHTATEIIRRDTTSQREWARLKRSAGL